MCIGGRGRLMIFLFCFGLNKFWMYLSNVDDLIFKNF